MWIFTKQGFFSIVNHRTMPDTYMVRARDEGDLKDLLDSFDGNHADIVSDTRADYRWRVNVDKSTLRLVVMKAMQDIDYTTSVKSELDKGDTKRHGAMMGVWTAMARMQPGGAYSSGLGTTPRKWDEPRLADLTGSGMPRHDWPLYDPFDLRDPFDDDEDLSDVEEDLFEFDDLSSGFVSVDPAPFPEDDPEFEVIVWNSVGKPTTVATFKSRPDAEALAAAITDAAESWCER